LTQKIRLYDVCLASIVSSRSGTWRAAAINESLVWG